MTTATHHELILFKRVTGSPVYGVSEELFGYVEDLVIEKSNGRALYVLISIDSVAGFEKSFRIIPWQTLHYDLGRDGYITALSSAELAGSPTFGRRDLDQLGAPPPSLGERLLGYYGRYGSVPHA